MKRERACLLTFVLDTVIVIDAFDRQEDFPASRRLLECGRAGQVVLVVSAAFDAEWRSGSREDALWSYVETLERGIRPSGRLGYARLDEWVLGYGGLAGELTAGKTSPTSAVHARQDEEHLESADVAGADVFVTRDKQLLSRRELLGVPIVAPDEALRRLGAVR